MLCARNMYWYVCFQFMIMLLPLVSLANVLLSGDVLSHTKAMFFKTICTINITNYNIHRLQDQLAYTSNPQSKTQTKIYLSF